MLRYSVSMPNPNSHYFEVKFTVNDFVDYVTDPHRLHVKMPVWTPGSYLIRDFSRNIPDLEADFIEFWRDRKNVQGQQR